MSAYIKWSAEFSAVILWWVLDSFDYSPACGCVNECHVQVIVPLIYIFTSLWTIYLFTNAAHGVFYYSKQQNIYYICW